MASLCLSAASRVETLEQRTLLEATIDLYRTDPVGIPTACEPNLNPEFEFDMPAQVDPGTGLPILEDVTFRYETGIPELIFYSEVVSPTSIGYAPGQPGGPDCPFLRYKHRFLDADPVPGNPTPPVPPPGSFYVLRVFKQGLVQAAEPFTYLWQGSAVNYSSERVVAVSRPVFLRL